MSILYLLILFAFLGCSKAGEEMVHIPPGEFIMGTDKVDSEGLTYEAGIIKPLYVDERPEHKVHLDGYYIDKFEVTNIQYKKFVDKTGHKAPPIWNGNMYPQGTENHPVVTVSWQDAADYCKWAGKRLPTEAEWEKAARGTDSREYSWGNEFSFDKANLTEASHLVGNPLPVGSFKEDKSPYGVFDMVGNVHEWTSTPYGPYPGNNYDSPDFKRGYTVIRGNSWAGVGHYPEEFYPKICAAFSRVSHRYYARPNMILNDTGFRCAKSR